MSPHTILIQACCWVIQMNINTWYIWERIGFDINTFSQFMFADGWGWSQNSTIYETGIENVLYSPGDSREL